MLTENWDRLSLTQKMDQFMEWFPKITKEESDFIESILHWDDETKAAFNFAKRMFEEPDDRVHSNSRRTKR